MRDRGAACVVLALALTGGAAGLRSWPAEGPAAPPAASPAAAALAAELIAAADEAARERLLTQRSDVPAPELCAALLARGRKLRNEGDWTSAEVAFDTVIQIAETAGLRAELASALLAVGDSKRRRGELALAAAPLERAEALYRELGNEKLLARVWIARGNLVSNLGQRDEADDFYRRSLEAFLRLGLPEAASIAQGNLGLASQARGDYAAALAAHLRALELDPKNASARFNVGIIHHAQAEQVLALDDFRRAAALDHEAGYAVDEAFDLVMAARVQAMTGDERGALDGLAIARAALETAGARAELGALERTCAQIDLQAGRPEAAIPHAEAAVAALGAAAPHLVPGALTVLAEARLALGQPLPALADAERALEIARKEEDWGALADSWMQIGAVHQALGHGDEARAAYRGAIEAIERQREHVAGDETSRQRFFEQLVDPYHRLLEIVARAGDDREAFRVSEQARARTLVDVLQHGHRRLSRRLLSPPEQEREAAAERALRLAQARYDAAGDRAAGKEAAARLDEARRERGAVRSALFTAHPELRVALGETEIVEPGALAPLLAKGSVAVAFTATERTLYLFVLAPRPAGASTQEAGVVLRVVSRPLGAKALGERVTAFRRSLAQRDLALAAQARALFEDVFGAVRGELRGRSRVYLIPDGALWELPFAALQPRAGRFFVEDSALVLAPSLTALAGWAARPSTPRHTDGYELLAVGRGEFSGGRPSLPDAERQAQVVAALYGSAGRLLVGAEATERKVKAAAPGARILHWATHGVLEPASPLYSALLLAPEKAGAPEDGRLEAREILDLDLHADLAVLSACETARGHVGAGEGVVGLSWALSVAGARNSVVSLWNVDAASTGDLMVAFHRRVRGGEAYGEALRGAALTLLRDPRTRHPFYWAPFILVGDGRAGSAAPPRLARSGR